MKDTWLSGVMFARLIQTSFETWLLKVRVPFAEPGAALMIPHTANDSEKTNRNIVPWADSWIDWVTFRLGNGLFTKVSLTNVLSRSSVKSGTGTQSSALVPGFRMRTKRRSEEHTSELQSRLHLVCRLLLEKKK